MQRKFEPADLWRQGNQVPLKELWEDAVRIGKGKDIRFMTPYQHQQWYHQITNHFPDTLESGVAYANLAPTTIIIVSKNLPIREQLLTIIHEDAHRTLNEAARAIGALKVTHFTYFKTNTGRFVEEAVAEGRAIYHDTRSIPHAIKAGTLFPWNNNYVNKIEFVIEVGGVGSRLLRTLASVS